MDLSLFPVGPFVIMPAADTIASMAKMTYKDAGVDLDVYRQSMARLPRLLARTQSPRVLPLEGGFAGLFQLDFNNRLFARKYEDPVLVACTDGVGTKLKVACAMGQHNTMGIDLVAMSVNDALCCGAEPLFFLDYVAMPKDDPELLEQLVEGVAEGCLQADCALLGGETAILPDLYAPGDYDLAGFCVGVVSRRNVIDGVGDCARRRGAGPGLQRPALQRLQPGPQDRLRRRRPEGGRLRRGVGPHGGRGPHRADADLHPADPPGVGPLSREERGARRGAHHRRRAVREPGPHRAGRRANRAPARQLAGARRCSHGCNDWARSSKPRWTRSSTLAWAWCWW